VARRAHALDVGIRIMINGRLQSREYQKKLEDDRVINRVAYEVSVTDMCVAGREESGG
jgi:single-stranded DNA-binding protein